MEDTSHFMFWVFRADVSEVAEKKIRFVNPVTYKQILKLLGDLRRVLKIILSICTYKQWHPQQISR